MRVLIAAVLAQGCAVTVVTYDAMSSFGTTGHHCTNRTVPAVVDVALVGGLSYLASTEYSDNHAGAGATAVLGALVATVSAIIGFSHGCD